MGFEWEGVSFEPDDGFTVVGFEAPDHHIVEGLPLGVEGARASWLAARLATLTEVDPRIFTGEVEVEEDGLFIVDLLAEVSGGKVLAKLQLQADGDEIAALGVSSDEASFDRALAALVAALESAPDDLRDVSVRLATSDEAEAMAIGRVDGELLRP